jgi:hypothetical protein
MKRQNSAFNVKNYPNFNKNLKNYFNKRNLFLSNNNKSNNAVFKRLFNTKIKKPNNRPNNRPNNTNKMSKARATLNKNQRKINLFNKTINYFKQQRIPINYNKIAGNVSQEFRVKNNKNPVFNMGRHFSSNNNMMKSIASKYMTNPNVTFSNFPNKLGINAQIKYLRNKGYINNENNPTNSTSLKAIFMVPGRNAANNANRKKILIVR